MKFGLQNSVMGWDDPWYPDASRTLMRTGEGQFFASQDPAPTKQAFIRLLQETFGVDFLMQHAMPQDERTEDFVRDMEKCGLQYMLGNEFGNINGPHCEGTNRYDVPQKLVRRAKRSENFLGLLYDETEHLQLHPSIYRKDARLHQWLTTPCKTEEECEEAIVNNVKRLVDGYGTDVYGECVFPSMMHLLARGGMHLSPKALKEEYQSVMFAVAMGACKQYKRKMCVTVDLWGFDVGEWFTRLWGFPAHGVQEFYNALVLSWYMSPDLLFVENCDPLAISRGDSFEITPFGEAYSLFLERYRGKTPPYSHSDVQCEIAVIHADDGVFSANGTFDGAGSYGFSEFPMNERKNSFFQVIHALSHGAVSPAGTTFWNTEFQSFPTAAYSRNEKTCGTLPLAEGVGKEKQTSFHKLFYPMHSVLVFDDLVQRETLGEPSLIIVCGERCRGETLRLVGEYAKKGTRVVVPAWLGENCAEECVRISDFCSRRFYEAIGGFLGDADEWTVSFENHRLKITNPAGDGNTLNFVLEEKK